jgi:thioredoxin reductase (NADPH)
MSESAPRPALREKALIVGAGPIGLACAISAKRAGIPALVVDAGTVVHSIVRYPVGMRFFTTPELLEIGDHPFPCAGEKPTREEALQYYRGVVRTERLRVRTHTKLIGARAGEDGIRCTLAGDRGPLEILTERLVLAIGYFDGPRRLDVPGEGLPHVTHYFDEPHLSWGRDVVVVGGKNSAVEAALEIWRAGGRVTLVHRGAELGATVKYWIRPDLLNRIAEGSIAARFSTVVERIEERAVVVRRVEGGSPAGEPESIAADRVYLLTGFRPDFELFRRIGIRLEGEDLRPAVDPETLETNVAGVHVVGSLVGGTKVSEIFIENGRFDGDKVFGRGRG